MSESFTCPPFGVASLGDYLADPATGQRVDEGDKFRGLVDLGVRAEELGFVSYHLGEHHFTDYALSAPAPMLAALAARTSTITLSTSVTLLPHHDPVFVAEDFATVDVLSRGRMEIVVGRGVYRAHYSLFGQNPDASEAMLDEGVALLRRLWTQRDVVWTGTIRPPLTGVTIHPRPDQASPRIIMSASSLPSVMRAVALGCGIALATVSTGKVLPGELVAAYRREWAASGRDPADAYVILHIHNYVGAGSSDEARAFWTPYQVGYLSWVGREVRGAPVQLPPSWTTLDQPDSQAVCGSVDDVASEVADRIAAVGGVDRFLVQTDQGGLPLDEVAASLERFATRVVPQVTERLAAHAARLASSR
jgi:alkanesulfonate monooxygenase SsuD/methylene tetrahydromethanopterin reductase-like flavin-dependent oxidoreductase (luciferase family)